MKVGLLVPTLNAGAGWTLWLSSLASQRRQPDRVLIIDSSSTDDTARLAAEAGYEVLKIARSTFDHGGTRQLGMDLLNDCDIVVCMTQDAVLASPDSLQLLLNQFHDPGIAMAYGRQLPHADATPLARHARTFNYPPESRVISLADRAQLGLRTAFCSNSFAAWRRIPLRECGGFARRCLLAEDMQACAQLLLQGWQVAYEAGATVYHSHNYSTREEFRRYFDTGAFHSQSAWLLTTFGSAGGEGLRYVATEWRAMRAAGWSWPWRSLFNNAAKWLGYQAGRHHRLLPKWCRPWFSLHPRWWESAGQSPSIQ